MSDADIDKAVKEAAEYEAQDKKRKEGIDARNDADAMVFQTEKALKDVGDKIADSDKSSVEADLKALKDILEATPADSISDEDIDKIKVAKEKLMASAQSLFTKVYEQSQGAAGNAGAGPDMSGQAGQTTSDSGNNDDVVDGDYREV